ncbi:hypothetical protein [uncultured Draconibacterium sp.]|uniref:hypothetical protein n=1 Tax=uncultured Draconibacterium sp. TaxID=1573823 RepID=UPI002AA80024|nr:hypothetical protein [uncultured Draconibacterium sp.]
MENIKFERLRISLTFLVLLIGFMIYVIRLLIAPLEMTIGVFNTVTVWIFISVIPVLIPLLFENKIMRVLTLILGGLIMIVNMALPLTIIIGNEMNEPITWEILMIIICGFSGLTGIVKTMKWIKN